MYLSGSQAAPSIANYGGRGRRSSAVELEGAKRPIALHHLWWEADGDSTCWGVATDEEPMHSIGTDLSLSLLYVSKGVPASASLCCVFLGDSDTKCNGQELCGLPILEAGIVVIFVRPG